MLRFLLSLLLALATTAPAAALEVVGDDLADEYVISGATFLNASTPVAREAADCTECHWRVIRICDSGSLDDRRGCNELAYSCSASIAEVWRADAPLLPPVGDPSWQYRGLMCLDSAPVSAPAVRTIVPDLARAAVPPLRPGTAPSPATLTNLRTSFFAGQGATDPATLVVAGAHVQLHLRPRWTWDFGHGATLTTTDPGNRGPTSGVSHVYPRRGTYRVTVTTAWVATYDVNGIDGFVVAETVGQSSAFDIRVKEARRYFFRSST